MAYYSKRETTVCKIQAGEIRATPPPQPTPFLQEGVIKTKKT